MIKLGRISNLENLFYSGCDNKTIDVYRYLKKRIDSKKSKTQLIIAEDPEICKKAFEAFMKQGDFKYAQKYKGDNGYSILTTDEELLIFKDISWLFKHFKEIDSIKLIHFVS